MGSHDYTIHFISHITITLSVFGVEGGNAKRQKF